MSLFMTFQSRLDNATYFVCPSMSKHGEKGLGALEISNNALSGALSQLGNLYVL